MLSLPNAMVSAPASEKLRAVHRVDGRQLQHEIHSVMKRCPCPAPFVRDGRFSALDEMRAHDRDEQIASALLARLMDMMDVSVVKRIVFNDDAADVHGFTSMPLI